MYMKDSTRKLLEDFAIHAHWKTAGLLSDIERFCSFIIEAYRSGEYDISQDEFLDVVNTSIKPQEGHATSLSSRKLELASKIFMYNKYEDGIKLLRQFERKT